MHFLASRSMSLAALVCFAAGAAAQGADLCANAQPITGTGMFSYDTSRARSDGPAENFEPRPGVRAMYNDVWFAWRAPTTSVYEISTCFPTRQWAATFVAVYAFGCPTGTGRAIAARGGYDCGLFTKLAWGTEAGRTYLIRIGHSVARNRDAGVFQISRVRHPAILGTAVNPANGRTYHILEPSSWSIAQAAAMALGGNLVTVDDQAENDWLNATFANWAGQRRSLWTGLNDAEVEGTWTWASGEPARFRNWSSDAPNNAHQYEHYVHFRRDRTDGTWNDLLGFPGTRFFYDSVHGVVEIGSIYPYGPATAGSGSIAPTLDAMGGGTIGSSLQLEVATGLGGAPAALLVGSGPASRISTPTLGGTLLVAAAASVSLNLSGPTGRAGAGRANLIVPIPNVPSLIGANVNFQTLVLDSGAVQGVSMTNGLALWIG